MSSLPYQDLSPAELDELLSAVLPDIPGYRVLRLLGRGGMSYVYLGIQESLDRQVAIKVVSPLALNDEVSLHRFEKEARTIAKLQHPDIVGIHAVGRMEWGLLYYVMPYLSRGHIGSRDLRGDQAGVVGVLRALLGALDYAHAQGVVHRDVKAENVLFDQGDRPMLTDFGIATSRRDRSRMTGAGNAIGSWGYMAPEQARGEQVDGRADLYSVGVLAFEMLTGRLPFHNEDTVALALMHAMDPVPALPADKAHWQPFVERAMAKSPDARFATARDMQLALDRIALTPPKAKTAPPPPLHTRLRTLPPAAWVAMAAMLVLVTVLVAGLWRSTSRDAPVQAGSNSTAIVVAPILPPPPAVPDMDESAALHEEGVETGVKAGDIVPEAVPELTPGEAALMSAEDQIRRHRLTQPPGASAIDSLLTAHRLLGANAHVVSQAGRWAVALHPYLETALAQHNDASARDMLAHAARLEAGLSLKDNKALGELRSTAAEAVRTDLRTALAAQDLTGLRAARERAQTLGVEAARLEPEYSQPVISARVGSTLAGNTPVVIVRMPDAAQAGLAAMPAAVTRDEYARFASATNRASSQCRIRTAAVTIKTRSWKEPGFAQSGDHPVVCVSLADARAYAAWLGQRDGVGYRLSGTAEWRLATAAPANASCAAAGVVCQSNATAVATAGAKSAAGVYSMLGNVREWPGDCAGCREHPLLGLGWRDATPARRGDTVNPEHGYDDVGFRLLREVPREALELR